MQFQGFISYSHDADDRLADALQKALHRFAKPWFRRRAIHVFRDKTNLSLNPALWPSIEKALSESEHFLLLASPRAAQSEWVQKETQWWCQNRDSATLLIILTDGEMHWCPDTNDFDWARTTALPRNLAGSFSSEPLYADLRWAKTAEQLSLHNGRFRDAVLDIAAPLHGTDKAALDGEDVRQHRRTLAVAWTAGTALFFLAVSAVVASFIARHETSIALSRELAANSVALLPVDPGLSVLLSLEALEDLPYTPQAEEALRQSLLQSRLQTVLKSDGPRSPFVTASFNPNGKFVVTAAQDGTVTTWRTATGLAIGRPIEAHSGPITGAVATDDLTRVITAGKDGVGRIWDLATSAEVATLTGHNGPLTGVWLSPDGQRVLTTSEDGTARLWHAGTGSPDAVLRGHTDSVLNASFSADGLRVVTASRDGTARIWDSASGAALHILTGHSASIATAAFSPSGGMIVTASDDGTVRLWESTTGNQVGLLKGNGGAVTTASFSPDGRRVLTGSADASVRVWDVKTHKITAIMRGHFRAVASAVFSPDGNLVLTGSRWENAATADNIARLWDANTGLCIAQLPEHWGGVNGVAFSRDGKWAITASADGSARIWRATVPKTFVHDTAVTSAQFNADGSKVITTGDDGAARGWDVTTGTKLFELAAHNNRKMWQASFSPDGRLVVTAGADGIGRVWELPSGRERIRLVGHSDEVTDASFSPDGALIVTASSDKTARIWDVATGRETRQLAGHDGPLNAARFCGNGDRMATASDDGTARVWDLRTGQFVTLHGHKASVGGVACSRDGNWVVTGSDDNSARIWDAGSGRAVAEFRGHKGSVNSVEFSPDGKWIVTASYDQTARVWRVGEEPNATKLTSQLRGRIETALFHRTPEPRVVTSATEFRGSTGLLWSASFSPDGLSIVTASSDGIARIESCEMCVSNEQSLEIARERRVRSGRRLSSTEQEKYLAQAARG
jgi:WD40 repeat protein